MFPDKEFQVQLHFYKNILRQLDNSIFRFTQKFIPRLQN